MDICGNCDDLWRWECEKNIPKVKNKDRDEKKIENRDWSGKNSPLNFHSVDIHASFTREKIAEKCCNNNFLDNLVSNKNWANDVRILTK
jgi:hypothetical protein